MPSAVTGSDDATVKTLEAVSPELVLVDPELGARERARLPERVVDFEHASAEVSYLDPVRDQSGRTPLTPALARTDGRLRHDRRHSWRVSAGAAAAIVIGLLLLDVRVEVGKNPAGAESGSIESEIPTLDVDPQIAASAPSPRVAPASPQPELRRFAWAPVEGAARYRVEIHRGPKRIFLRETMKPEVTVPRTWRLEGRRHVLRPGEYRWYVWPIVSGRRAARAVVQASLSIPAA